MHQDPSSFNTGPFYSLDDEKKHIIDIHDPLEVKVRSITVTVFESRGRRVAGTEFEASYQQILAEIKQNLPVRQDEQRQENKVKIWSTLACLGAIGSIGSLSYVCAYANSHDLDFASQTAGTLIPLMAIITCSVSLLSTFINGSCPDRQCLTAMVSPETDLHDYIQSVAERRARQIANDRRYLTTFTALSEVKSISDTRPFVHREEGNINNLDIAAVIHGYS